MAKMPPAAKPVTVAVEVVASSSLDDEIFVSGTLLGNESVQIQPETQGKIVGIYFSEGQRVSKGQLLVKLNDAELQASLKKAVAQAKLAAEKEARLKKLLEINGVSREEYENALNQWQSLQADIESIQAKLDETEIRAPFSGTIGLRSASVGSFVSPTSTIATLEQLDQVKLDISIPEKYADIATVGSELDFMVEGNSQTYKARIYAIDPKIDEDTRSLKLRGICANPSGVLHAGAFAKVKLQLRKSGAAILVPTESLVPDMKGNKVFLVKQGTLQPQPVTIGIRTSDRVEITKGLFAGDSLVVTGVMQAKPGAKAIVLPNKK